MTAEGTIEVDPCEVLNRKQGDGPAKGLERDEVNRLFEAPDLDTPEGTGTGHA